MKERGIIILVIVIILVIIFFLFVGRFGVINVNTSPTGFVDIFDITVVEGEGGTCCCGCESGAGGNCTCVATSVDTTDSNNHSCANNESGAGGITVYDDEVEYTNKTRLNIFTHQSYYIVDNLIAPESQNSYQFIIRNNNEFAIEYSLKIEEENPHNINMRYKLSKNGTLIIGDEDNWVTANELKNEAISLDINSYDVYTLDWKWFESDNDTEIGTKIDANYQLDISFFAISYS